MVTETNEPSSFQINKLTEGRRKRINPGNLNSMLGPYTLNIKKKKTFEHCLLEWYGSSNSNSLVYILRLSK